MENIGGICQTEIEPVVFISQEQLEDVMRRRLYGKYFPDTRIFNVFPPQLQQEGEFLGEVLEGSQQVSDEFFCAVAVEGTLTFYSEGHPIKVEVYGLYQSIFSRNKGILETDVMSRKKAVILGCGSVGSLVAMELARAGVGHFLLSDSDVVEYHNVCRHQCGISDVGDLKVNALTRKLKNINPNVTVMHFAGVAQNIPKLMLDDFCVAGETVFVGCADNRDADVYANRISIYYRSFFISIGFWERAFAGEIFYHIPGRGMPCYGCALGDGGNLSARAQANHHVYSNQEHTEGLKFEPGISVDINFITTIGVKLILDLLNATNEEYIPRLLHQLTQYTLVCNTCDPKIGGEMVEIFSYPLQVTTSLVAGFGRQECMQASVCKYEQENR